MIVILLAIIAVEIFALIGGLAGWSKAQMKKLEEIRCNQIDIETAIEKLNT